MAKTKDQKKELYAAYQEVVDRGNFVVIETDRLPASVITKLRKALAEVEGKMYVIKNKVFAKAVENNEELKGQEYVGQLSVLDGGSDIVAVVKSLDEAKVNAKAHKVLQGFSDEEVKAYIPFTHKFGYLGGKVISDADVARLASMPDKQTMLGILVGTMAAPLTGFMNVMQGVPRAMVYALTDLQNKKAE